MNHSNNASPDAPPPPTDRAPQLAVRIFGVGEAGGKVIDYLAAKGFGGATFIVIDTDALALSRSTIAHRVPLGAARSRGLGAGGDPELGWTVAEADAETLRQHCAGADIVFIISGLGRGTGTGASPVLARVAREAGALVVAIAILPFACEGAQRQRQALQGLQQLKAEADGVIGVSNERLANLVDEKTSLTDTYLLTNEFIRKGLHGLWRLVARPGLIPVDFPTLCQVLRTPHAESALASAEAQGPNRVREAVEALAAHPLLENGQALAEAAQILVGVVGGPELTPADLARVSELLSRQAEKAQITLGAAIDEEYRDRLEITVVVTWGMPRIEAPAVAFRTPAEAAPDRDSDDAPGIDGPLLNEPDLGRPASRLVPPPPALAKEEMEHLWRQQMKSAPRAKRAAGRLQQGQLPLEIVSKGRFDKSEPTVHRGEDLDMPTYIRRGISLN